MTGEVAPTRPARRGGTARKKQRISIKLPKYRLKLLSGQMRAFEKINIPLWHITLWNI